MCDHLRLWSLWSMGGAARRSVGQLVTRSLCYSPKSSIDLAPGALVMTNFTGNIDYSLPGRPACGSPLAPLTYVVAVDGANVRASRWRAVAERCGQLASRFLTTRGAV